MNKYLVRLSFVFAVLCAVMLPARAQIPTTDVANIVSQGAQYAQQLLEYERQGLQLKNDIEQLKRNPFSLLGSEIGGIINDVGRIMTETNTISRDMARLDRGFATTFKAPSAAVLSYNMTHWHKTNTDALDKAMASIGQLRSSYDSDTAAIKAVVDASTAGGGTVAALDTLRDINVLQLSQTRKLGEVMVTQNEAMNTYMAGQVEKAKGESDAATAVADKMNESLKNLPPLPTWEIDKTPATRWDMYSKKK